MCFIEVYGRGVRLRKVLSLCLSSQSLRTPPQVYIRIKEGSLGVTSLSLADSS